MTQVLLKWENGTHSLSELFNDTWLRDTFKGTWADTTCSVDYRSREAATAALRARARVGRAFRCEVTTA